MIGYCVIVQESHEVVICPWKRSVLLISLSGSSGFLMGDHSMMAGSRERDIARDKEVLDQ